jgi:lysophospholipase L1-like esterase
VAKTARQCFKSVSGLLGADYDQFHPTINSECSGTDHQDIKGVEHVVFLGDSVTVGTPPTPTEQFYRTLLSDSLRAKFGDIEITDCSRFGARNDDFLLGTDAEIPTCFPDGGDKRRTLTIFTMGGNDIASWAGDDLATEAATVEADKSAVLLDDAITWLKDPKRFPNGSYVVFGNPYEFTDGTGDLQSCPLASTAFGMTTNWIKGALAVAHFQERYMELAVKHQVDMVFMLETFCGHGYHSDDPSTQCYRGPDAPRWFDLTCIHPNPEGHAVLADLFLSVVNE